MAIAPRDIPITRDQVDGWIDSWNQDHGGKTLTEHIHAQVDTLALPDPYVLTLGHDSMADQMPLADFIMLDINSYSNYVAGS